MRFAAGRGDRAQPRPEAVGFPNLPEPLPGDGPCPCDGLRRKPDVTTDHEAHAHQVRVVEADDPRERGLVAARGQPDQIPWIIG
jgi:hypothetical protein